MIGPIMASSVYWYFGDISRFRLLGPIMGEYINGNMKLWYNCLSYKVDGDPWNIYLWWYNHRYIYIYGGITIGWYMVDESPMIYMRWAGPLYRLIYGSIVYLPWPSTEYNIYLILYLASSYMDYVVFVACLHHKTTQYAT